MTCSVSIGLAAAVGDKALRVVANTCAEDGFNERVEGGVFAQVTHVMYANHTVALTVLLECFSDDRRKIFFAFCDCALYAPLYKNDC